MKKLLLLVLILNIGFYSCKDVKSGKEEPSQMDRVISIHDEVMPKMGEISKLISQLNTIKDTVDNPKKYEEAIEKLQGGYSLMMTWMKDFGDRFTSDEVMKGKELSEEKQLWLNEEEDKVKEVKNRVESSIEYANKLLKELE